MTMDATTFIPEVLDELQGRAVVSVSSPETTVHDSASEISVSLTSDEELLERVGLGSRDALGLLFRRHGRSVFNVSFRILKDRAEADDLRQEVFLYLFQQAKHFDPRKGTASSWLIQIAYHRAIDRRRKLHVRGYYSPKDPDDIAEADSQAQSASAAIDVDTILNRLDHQLTGDQQRTLELHFFDGLTFREIAEMRGQSLDGVRKHYYRALERLRSLVFSEKRG